MRLFNLSAAVGLALAGQILVAAYPAEAKIDRRHHDSWQARVAQAHGRVTRDPRPPGKQGAAGAADAVATAGQTCNSSNAATPYCYTATQQSALPPEGELFAAAQAARAISTTPTSPVTGKTPLSLAVLGALAAGAR